MCTNKVLLVVIDMHIYISITFELRDIDMPYFMHRSSEHFLSIRFTNCCSTVRPAELLTASTRCRCQFQSQFLVKQRVCGCFVVPVCVCVGASFKMLMIRA